MAVQLIEADMRVRLHLMPSLLYNQYIYSSDLNLCVPLIWAALRSTHRTSTLKVVSKNGDKGVITRALAVV